MQLSTFIEAIKSNPELKNLVSLLMVVILISFAGSLLPIFFGLSKKRKQKAIDALRAYGYTQKEVEDMLKAASVSKANKEKFDMLVKKSIKENKFKGVGDERLKNGERLLTEALNKD